VRNGHTAESRSDRQEGAPQRLQLSQKVLERERYVPDEKDNKISEEGIEPSILSVLSSRPNH